MTVTRSESVCRARPEITLVDLPGVYALRPYSDEERVTRSYLLGGAADAVISIADATCPARSLYLTLQLLELGVPVVLALNVMDALRAGGGSVDTAELARALGIRVIPVSAALGEGLDALLDAAAQAAHGPPPDPWRALPPSGPVQACVRTLARLLSRLRTRRGCRRCSRRRSGSTAARCTRRRRPKRQRRAWYARAALPRDEALPTARFAQVDRLTRFFTLPRALPGSRRSARIDRVLTGRYTAYPAMAGLLGGVFYLTFHIIGPCLSRLLARGIAWLADAADGALTALDTGPLLHGLVREGVFAGVGSVAAFLPVILALFFFLSLLEDTGYLARVAFVMDRPLRRLGLSGQSAVPLLLGFGCSVPGVLAARTLPTRRDRALTIVLTPCMSCSAKAPVYAAFSAAFFPGRSAVVFLALYALGIGTAAGAAPLLGRTALRGEAASFVMELPDYRWPNARSVLRRMWVRTRNFSRGRSRSSSRRAWACGYCGRSHPRGAWRQVPARACWPWWDRRSRRCSHRWASALARRDRARDRTAGQGDGAVHARRAARRRPDGGAAGRILPSRGGELLVFTALYAPCVAAQAAMRQELGSRLGTLAAAAGLVRRGVVCGGGRLPHRCPAMRKQQASKTGSLLFSPFLTRLSRGRAHRGRDCSCRGIRPWPCRRAGRPPRSRAGRAPQGTPRRARP